MLSPDDEPAAPARRPRIRRPEISAPWRAAAAITIGFVVLLYAVEGVDWLDGNRLDQDGIKPRESDGLLGIVFAPLLHHGWGHLLANTVPVLVLGFLALLTGIARGLAATAIVWVVGGVGTWLSGGPHSVHLGASVLVFGWLTYLIARGIFTRNVVQIVVGVAVLALYGSALWGVLPGQPGISWQGHLFGAIGGILAAWLLSSGERARRRDARVCVPGRSAR